MNDIIPENSDLKIGNRKLQNTREKHYIKHMLASFPVLTNKLTPDNIYNNSAIKKNGNWDDFKESLITFLRNKESEYKTKSRSSGVPPSARPLPSARPPPSAKPTSARPLPSALPSTRTPKSTIAKPKSSSYEFHEQNLKRSHTDAASVPPGTSHTLSHEMDIGGGSRRRRSSHRKRKSYRKSKRVRHTRRKQTRRHRHRRSRHRHRR